MLDEQLNRLIIEIYQGSHEIPLQDFKPWAMAKLKQALSFDSGLWVVGDSSTLTAHSVHLENLPAEMVQSYERYKHTDPLTEATLRFPLRAFDLREVYRHLKKNPIYWEHCVPYQIEHAIVTASPRQTTGLQTLVCCYRAPGQQEFSEDERRLKQHFFSHLLQALTFNQLFFLERGAARPNGGGALALCDGHGYLHRGNAAFDSIVRSEWCEWPGLRLPTPLRKLLGNRKSGAQHKGKNGMFKFLPVGDLFAVSARPASCLDLLTPRQKEIAQHLAQGRTYKEIAILIGVKSFTVTTHVNTIYERLGIHSKAALAALYYGEQS